MPSPIPPLLRVENMAKRYGGFHALEGVNFELFAGEHVAIVGDNGAGKSTFVRQVTGVERPTAGRIFFDEKEVHFTSPLDARRIGIETVYQNLALANDLDVPANIFLGREEVYFRLGPFSFLNERRMLRQAQEGLERTAVKIPDLRNIIRNMSGGQRQCIAISRAATLASKLIIMDEPTAALGVQETAQVESIIRNLKTRGVPLILISHNLRQAFDLTDRIFDVAAGVLGPNFQDMMIAHMATADGIGFEVFQFVEPNTLQAAKGNVEWRAGFFHIALTHPDVAEIVETIKQAGGKQRSPVLYNYENEPHCICYCEDPFGNVVEIMSTRYERLFSNR